MYVGAGMDIGIRSIVAATLLAAGIFAGTQAAAQTGSQNGAQTGAADADPLCAFTGAVRLEAVWHLPEYDNPSDPTDVGDYEMKLLGDITYRDCAGNRHLVKEGVVVNGASIPRAAWSLLGYTPWSGRSQRPAILHDHLCEDVLFTSDRVHELFYEALKAEGVADFDARLMYAAVLNFGPQWDTPSGTVRRPTYRGAVMRLMRKLLVRNLTIAARLWTGLRPQGIDSTVLETRSLDRSALSDAEALGDIRDLSLLLDTLSDRQILELNAFGRTEVDDFSR